MKVSTLTDTALNRTVQGPALIHTHPEPKSATLVQSATAVRQAAEPAHGSPVSPQYRIVVSVQVTVCLVGHCCSVVLVLTVRLSVCCEKHPPVSGPSLCGHQVLSASAVQAAPLPSTGSNTIDPWHPYCCSSSLSLAFYYFCCVCAGPYRRYHRMRAVADPQALDQAVVWAMQRTTNCWRDRTRTSHCWAVPGPNSSHWCIGTISVNASPSTFPDWCSRRSSVPFINSQTHCSVIRPKEYGK